MQENELLDMENVVHRTCLYLVFCGRIEAALDRGKAAWNHHPFVQSVTVAPLPSGSSAVRRRSEATIGPVTLGMLFLRWTSCTGSMVMRQRHPRRSWQRRFWSG
ncbi:hypothetical protein C8F01DRAFT_1143018 [Mycena amicta]|nr:hypothetical protein C8F01DRAFT_1143018 [Mycena amicta]